MARHSVPGIVRIRLRKSDSRETFSHKGIPPISLVCMRTGIRPSWTINGRRVEQPVQPVNGKTAKASATEEMLGGRRIEPAQIRFPRTDLGRTSRHKEVRPKVSLGIGTRYQSETLLITSPGKTSSLVALISTVEVLSNALSTIPSPTNLSGSRSRCGKKGSSTG